MNRRIGILGGTFDPIHRGHIDLGMAAMRALNLGRLFVIPSHVPPHRGRTFASPFHRFAMAALAVAGRPGWRASDVELRVAEVPSYTTATLRRFHERGYRPSDIFFVIGADAFADVTSWHDASTLFKATNFAVVSRPGHPVNDLARRLPQLAPMMASPGVEADEPLIFLIDAPTADVSSTAIRGLRAAGRPITGLVEPSVEQHIEQHELYAASVPGRRRNDPPPARAAGGLHG